MSDDQKGPTITKKTNHILNPSTSIASKAYAGSKSELTPKELCVHKDNYRQDAILLLTNAFITSQNMRVIDLCELVATLINPMSKGDLKALVDFLNDLNDESTK